MASVFRSIVFYAAFYGATAILVILAFASMLVGGAGLPWLAHRWTAIHHLCVTGILGITLREVGERQASPALYAIKHESFFEALEVPNFLDHPVIFAKDELFRLPVWGRAARLYGLVPVARGEGSRALRAMIADARRFAQSGRPLVIFPEGTRIPHGERPPLRSGFAALYKVLGLPVVPVAVDSGPLYHRLWKRRGTITLRFGEPVPPGLSRAEAETRVREAINALNA